MDKLNKRELFITIYFRKEDIMGKDLNWKDFIIWILLVLGLILFVVSFLRGG